MEARWYIVGLAAIPLVAALMLILQKPPTLTPNSPTAISAATSTTGESAARPRNNAKMGLVLGIKKIDASSVVQVDFVEWLEGEEARQAAAADTECDATNAEDCVATLANNFYIRNTEKRLDTYPLAPHAQLILLDGITPMISTIAETERFIDQYKTLLSAVEITDGAVVRIEQIYMP